MNKTTTERIADLQDAIDHLRSALPAGETRDAAVAALVQTQGEIADGTFQELRPIEPAPVHLEIYNASGYRVA